MTRSVLIDHIGLLVTNDPSLGDGPLATIPNAALVIGQRADRTADTWDDETGLLDAVAFSATAADVTTLIIDGDIRWRTP